MGLSDCRFGPAALAFGLCGDVLYGTSLCARLLLRRRTVTRSERLHLLFICRVAGYLRWATVNTFYD